MYLRSRYRNRMGTSGEPTHHFRGRTSETPATSRKRRASRHPRNWAGISNANTVPPLSVIENVRIALGVIGKRDALQDSLPAIGGVERGKRSDELIEKRGLGSQK